jgi:hypothetical protein
MLNQQKRKIMAQKVKMSAAVSKATAAKVGIPPPPWIMNPALYPICQLIESYDIQSDTGKQMYLLLMAYEKKCAQAKIDLIEEITNLLNQSMKK